MIVRRQGVCLCSLAHSSYLHLLQGKILDDEYLCSERALPYECAVSLVSHSDAKTRVIKKKNNALLKAPQRGFH